MVAASFQRGDDRSRHVVTRARGVDADRPTRRRAAPRAARVAGARAPQRQKRVVGVASLPAETSSPRRRTTARRASGTSPVTRRGPARTSRALRTTVQPVGTSVVTASQDGTARSGTAPTVADGGADRPQQPSRARSFPRRDSVLTAAPTDPRARGISPVADGRSGAQGRGVESPVLPLGDRVLTGAGDRSRTVDLTGKQLAVFSRATRARLAASLAIRRRSVTGASDGERAPVEATTSDHGFPRRSRGGLGRAVHRRAR